MADEETYAETKPKVEGEVINLIVKDGNGTEVHFKVKPHTKFEKVMSAYCQKKGMDIAHVRFLFDGERIRKEQTPSEIGMEDGDSIDAVIEQVGGLA